MRIPTRIAFLLVVSALCAGATAGTARPATAKTGRLVAFTSCPSLLGYARTQAARLVGPYGLGQAVKVLRSGVPGSPSAAPSAATATASDSARQEGVDYSGTNVQEVGVDEPDTVKTDGETVFAVANGRLNAVDVSGAKPRLLDTL